MTDFNWVDYVVLGIFFASVVAGLVRGLVKETIGLLTWIAAFVIAIMFSTKLAVWFTGSEATKELISNASASLGGLPGEPISMLSIGISFVCIFVGVLILGKIINYFISSAIEGNGISFANRLLGGIFGLGRGFLLVLLMMFVVGMTPFASQAIWTQSKFVVSFQPAVVWLANLVEPSIETFKSKVGQTLKNVNTTYIQGASNIFQK